jgi:pyruvate/2-oxoglutarate dehydrogenase complex dihydrolipoamide acyltransferase (E2) component
MGRVEVTLPRWGATMEEATVVEWLKQVGDEVRRDEPICVVETDKVDAEVVSPADGVLAAQAAQRDDVVVVGGALGAVETR